MKRASTVAWPFLPRAARVGEALIGPRALTSYERLPDAATVRWLANGAPWRGWAVALFLFLLPLVVYWPSVVQRYGFRDDYAVLRESHEEPAKVVSFCTAQARPVYGLLLAGSFRLLDDVDALSQARVLATALLGLVAVACYFCLLSQSWKPGAAVLVCALLVLVPSAQILVSWTVAWPRTIALLAAIGAFGIANKAFAQSRTKPWRWAAAVSLVVVSALTYPSDTLLYVSLVTAGSWTRRSGSWRSLAEWCVRHLVTLGIGVATAFTAMTFAFARGWVATSGRVALESNVAAKFAWFGREPLANAAALIRLNHDGAEASIRRTALLVGLVLVAGIIGTGLRHGWRTVRWTLLLPLLLVGSFAVNFAVADAWAVYRVLLPLTMTVTIALVAALSGAIGPWLTRATWGVVLVPAAWLARDQTRHLIAEPQAQELRSVEAAAARIDPEVNPRVFIRLPRVHERVADWVFHDEFGSLSADSDWSTREMLKRAMQERFPGRHDVTRHYTLMTGRTVPVLPRPDVILDLVRLRAVVRSQESLPTVSPKMAKSTTARAR